MAAKVVIVGGGYGGIRVMQQLSGYKEIEVVLVDQHPYHYLQTEAYALIAQQATLSDVTVDLPALCASYPRTTFVRAKVTGMDCGAKRLLSEQGEIPFVTMPMFGVKWPIITSLKKTKRHLPPTRLY